MSGGKACLCRRWSRRLCTLGWRATLSSSRGKVWVGWRAGDGDRAIRGRLWTRLRNMSVGTGRRSLRYCCGCIWLWACLWGKCRRFLGGDVAWALLTFYYPSQTCSCGAVCAHLQGTVPSCVLAIQLDDLEVPGWPALGGVQCQVSQAG